MKEYYKIMEDILEVEYRIRATVYVLDELEKSYSIVVQLSRQKFKLFIMN